ncbi:hypothetical protein [Nannocystis radixulma]|uniref:WD40-like Beta Propeller Repeat n=1 Tax=Nannocystis radixulma TaxID=2995305 RepID=A0ABT5B285_9BACT|nr:hypothetical protein [Nannocystis radixulma]MDC0668220.1 hypothetical protein [Nannocystis radixulma]
MALATACPAGPGDPNDTAGTTEPTTTETATEPGTTTIEPTTTTGTVPTTGGDTTTTSETTGGPVQGGARVVYSTLKPQGGPRELFFVDCTGDTPGPATRIHEPLAEGWGVVNSVRVSTGARWMHYTLGHATEGQQVWLVDMSGPVPGAPVQVDMPPELLAEFGPGEFSHDEAKLAMLLAQPGGGRQLFLCTIAPDGGCTPEAWGVPLQPGATQGFTHHFSPDDTRIAYLGDPDGDGVLQLFLAGTAPGDAGSAVVVSGDAPLDDVFDKVWFSKDGGTLYFAFGPDPNLPGVRAVDITSDPPGSPQTVVPVGGRHASRSDDSAVLWGKDGELSFISLAGTKPGPTLPLHTVPGFVAGDQFAWSTDGRFALYLAAAEDHPNSWELFAADVSGPTPGEPFKASAPIAASGFVLRAAVGPDPSYAVYAVAPELGASDELWMVPLDPPDAPVELSGPLPPMSMLPGTIVFSGDGSRILYTVSQGMGALDLFLVDKANPGAAVQVNAPLPSDEDVWSAEFTQDGQRVVYTVRGGPPQMPEGRALLVDVDAPGQELLVSDPAHNVGVVHVLPPSSE